MAEKTQGGGSILDQSHIMDLVHYLLGGFKSVFAFNSNISSLELNSDDIAEMVVTLKNDVIALQQIYEKFLGRAVEVRIMEDNAATIAAADSPPHHSSSHPRYLQ